MEMELAEWHVIISGFRQKSGTLNGTVVIWSDLIRLVANRPGARVELITWNADVEDLAERISRLAPVDAMPLVNVYGYSYGGMTAANFARELRRRGVEVNHMVLCDAVYRHWYRLGWWRSFFSWWSIKIPDNVKRVTQFRQRESLPMGHKIKVNHPGRTKLGPIQWLKTDHCWADDSVAFRKACLQAAKSGRVT